METQKTPQSQSSFEKENGVGGINLSDFRINLSDYKATVIKTSMVLAQKQKHIPMEQDRKQSPEINPCTYGYLIFDKGGKNIQWGKDNLFNKWCWKNWTAICERMKLEHHT